MRLQLGLTQVAAHLGHGDRRDNFAFDHFVGQFGVGPVGDGATGFFRGFAGHGEDLSDLLGGEGAGGAGAVDIGENPLDGTSQGRGVLAAFDLDEAVKGFGPARRQIPTWWRSRPTCTAMSSLGRPSKANRMMVARCCSRTATVAESRRLRRMVCCRSVMVTLAALPGKIKALLWVEKWAKIGKDSKRAAVMEPQLRLAGLAH